ASRAAPDVDDGLAVDVAEQRNDALAVPLDVEHLVEHDVHEAVVVRRCRVVLADRIGELHCVIPPLPIGDTGRMQVPYLERAPSLPSSDRDNVDAAFTRAPVRIERSFEDEGHPRSCRHGTLYYD